jgi:hypothetical protein
VVNVSVRQNDRLNRGRINRKWLPVSQPQRLQPLEKAAIDQKLLSVNFNEVA